MAYLLSEESSQFRFTLVTSLRMIDHPPHCKKEEMNTFVSKGLSEIPFIGTVRPDWICMRVVSLESPLKAHQPL
jgi:hypothetical protein